MQTQISQQEELRQWFTGEHPRLDKARRVFRLLPGSPRCNLCTAPFGGIGGALVRRAGFGPWPKNPNVCTRCVVEISRLDIQGTDVELSMMFADVRGSTALGEGMAPSDFSALMNRFFQAATDVLLEHEALVDKFVGDEVIGLFIPAIAGPRHPQKAVQAALALLRETGHGRDPWLPIGVGVHTGPVFLGMVGGDQVGDFTAMGDNMNLTARLAGAARAGEVLITDGAWRMARIDRVTQCRNLELKGIDQPVETHVLTVPPIQ